MASYCKLLLICYLIMLSDENNLRIFIEKCVFKPKVFRALSKISVSVD